MDKILTYKARFFKKVNKTDSCWLWVGAVNSRGYGCLTINKKRFLAHRISYIWHKGEIAEGLLVCHSCDVRRCVNPDHLWLGTYTENNEDMWKKGRNVRSSGNKNGYNQHRKNPNKQ